MSPRERIILIGFDGIPACRKLTSRLSWDGFDTLSARSASGLPGLLDRCEHAAIVVYCPRGRVLAEAVLKSVFRAHRRTPVIVLTDRSDFGQYHDLMLHGAYGYYELSEDSAVISHGIEWTARTQAA